MGQTKDYLGLIKLAEAAAARTASPVARNYWIGVAEKNRQLAAEALTHKHATLQSKDKDHPVSS